MYTVIKNYAKRILNGGYSIQWFNSKCKPYYDQLAERDKTHIFSKIPHMNNLALESRAKEMFIENNLEQNKYSLDCPLIIINPYGIAPLSALILFNTTEPCTVQYTICGNELNNDLTQAIEEPKTKHRIPIIGLYESKRNKIVIKVTTADGQYKTKTLYIKMPSLKNALADSVQTLKTNHNSSVEYIYISGGFSQHSYMIDTNANIRFYFNKKVKLYGTHMLSNGHILFPEEEISNPTFSNPHSTVFHEMDFMGRVHKTYMVENGVHHYAAEKGEGGNILLATSTLIPPYGMENAVIEIDRNTGEVVKLLDLTPLFDETYLTRHDWAHINSIQYLTDEDAVILSLRNLHSVVKIQWETQEIEWILGDIKFWEPTTMMEKVLKPTDEDITWFYQQHAADVVSSNHGVKELLIYDNHIATRRPLEHFIETKESNLLIYTVDENNKTVSKSKMFPLQHFSTIRSNGVLIKDKNRIWGMSAFLRPKVENFNAMINEFDFTTGQIVNQFGLKHDFFSAYPLTYHAADMTKPLDLTTPYEVGNVILPQQIELSSIKDIIANAEIADTNYFETFIYSKLLLIKETDNEIRHVYAIGKKYAYDLDKNNTIQKAPGTFANQRYFITFPLDTCETDCYTFYLKTNEKIYVLENTIEIKQS